MKKHDEVIENRAVETEQWTGAHLVMAGIYTALSLLLIVFTLLLSWEPWVIPMILAGIAAVWFVHIGQVGTDRFQRYLYVTLMLVELFYYGAHEDGFFDLPVAISILILVLPTFDEMRLVYAAVGVYAVEVVYHVGFHDRIRSGVDMETLSRLILGITAVASSALASRFLIIRRREERKEFRKMIEVLRETNRRSEDFLANVSHELRTPINAVTGISSLLLERELPPDLEADMYSIQEAGKRLAGRIDDILDYMDLATKHLALNRGEFLITSSVNDMIAMADTQNNGKNLELVFDVDPELPSILVGDEAKLRRVVKILLENAIKFTEKGGIYIRIGYRKESYGINMSIDLCDTGIGMTAAQLSQVCLGFYQVDSGRSRRNSGLGLGLAIAHGMVHAMGGFMNITSVQEKGTQVRLSIPHMVESDEPCMALQTSASQCVACYVRQDRHSGEVRDFYERMLKSLGDGVGVKIHYVYYFSDLQSLLKTGNITHLLVAQAEYEENPDYYEDLDSGLFVALIARHDFKPPEGSRLFLLHKPLYGLSIVNFLNESESIPRSSHDVNPMGTLSCAGVKALVVDDDAMNLTVAKGILSNYGMEVDTCLGGQAALDKCMETEYDVAFLDHMMPDMDGVETLRQLRKICNGKYEGLPVVALTANAVSGAREMFKNEGFNEFVAKPIERSVLERVLRKLLPGKCRREKEAAPREEPGRKPPMQEIAPQGEASPIPAAAGAAGGAGEDTSPLSLLRQNGFNVKDAIGYCAGSEEFYLEIMDNFYSEIKAKRAEITSLFEENDWANYTIKVHALKSASRTIGADELSGCAARLEQAGKDGDIKYIEENHPALMGLYEECQALIELCTGAKAEESADGEDGQEADGVEIPEEAWQEAMENLKAAFDTFESEQAENIIKELSEFTRHGRSCKEMLVKISKCVEDFDFDAAGEELCRLCGEGDGL